jgi:hypothetical protein
MRRTASVVATAGLVCLGSLVMAAPAHADRHPDGPPPLHGHMLVLGVKYVDDQPVGFRKCVELAGGRALPLKAHHQHAHTGRAGEALMAAGHLVVPMAPLTPFTSCAQLKQLFPA